MKEREVDVHFRLDDEGLMFVGGYRMEPLPRGPPNRLCSV